MMTKNLILILFWLISQTGYAQVTALTLQQAVQQNHCHEIANELDSLQYTDDQMKFNAGVCLYRTGAPEKALVLFTDISHGKGDLWKMAAFWVAKINASLGHDSLAVSMLTTLPKGFLNPVMLDLPEFDHLAGESSKFAALKKELKPKLNIWTGLLAGISGIGFIIGIVFLLGRSRFSDGEKWLALMVLSMAVILCSYLTIWTGYKYYFPYIQHFWPFLTFLIGPSIYFYLKETFKEEYSTREVAGHLIIPVISFVFLLPAILRSFGVAHSFPPDFVRVGSSSALLTSHILFYTIIIHFQTRNEWQVDANIKTWTNILSWGMKIYTFAFLSYFVLVSTSFFNPQWDYAISIVMGIGILIIAYMGLVQKRVFRSEPIGDILSVKKYSSSSLTTSVSDSIRDRLEKLLNEEEVFKENELRLDDLASYLEVNRHQLSQVINQYYQVNFFELMNQYRVAYVKKVLADPTFANYTIIQLAYEAGFNNKASFNKYFKREVGLTPSAYRIKESSLLVNR